MSIIYYVEDDADIRNLVVYTLNMTGQVAQGFENHASFQAAMENRLPDLVLLDVMLPGKSGFDILRDLKREPATMHIPVVMVTARDGEDDKVSGLETGADDYISKPFGVMEMIARVKAVLRRCAAPKDMHHLCCGSICMDTEQHKVEVNGCTVQLTLKEFALLQLLMEADGRLVDRDVLINRVWGENYTGADHTLDAHIRTLRGKLGESSSCIQTVYGRGYRLRTEASG